MRHVWSVIFNILNRSGLQIFEKPQKFMYESDDELSKNVFYYDENNNKMNNNIENVDFVTL